jgi:hypothetical protein
MLVHLIDGTYELFRCYYGLRRPRGARTGTSWLSSVCWAATQYQQSLKEAPFDEAANSISILAFCVCWRVPSVQV